MDRELAYAVSSFEHDHAQPFMSIAYSSAPHEVQIEASQSLSAIPVEECGGVVDLRVQGIALAPSLSYRSDLTKRSERSGPDAATNSCSPLTSIGMLRHDTGMLWSLPGKQSNCMEIVPVFGLGWPNDASLLMPTLILSHVCGHSSTFPALIKFDHVLLRQFYIIQQVHLVTVLEPSPLRCAL
jgi:hypothetical protein